MITGVSYYAKILIIILFNKFCDQRGDGEKMEEVHGGCRTISMPDFAYVSHKKLAEEHRISIMLHFTSRTT